jgi:hydrogenase large subunit
MDQKFTREDTEHAWYDEPGGLHPFDRTTVPTQKNTVDMAGKYFLGNRRAPRGKRPP